jgi:hypothetical protein
LSNLFHTNFQLAEAVINLVHFLAKLFGILAYIYRTLSGVAMKALEKVSVGGAWKNCTFRLVVERWL